MLDRRLQMIASNWQRKSDIGDMPQALYDAIADGSESVIDKKIIRNLAKVSRIIGDDGEVRKFSEFKLDWRYSHSTFGRTDTCTICGQSPIVENCVLVDDVRKVEIVIGNKCVHRYMDIIDPQTGQAMNTQDRADFLKGETKAAKDEYTRQKWMTDHPFIFEQLKENEEFMKSDSKLKKLHTTITKRMASHGFPGPKARRQWAMFIVTADASRNKWIQDETQKRHRMRVRAEKAEAKKGGIHSNPQT